MWETLLCPSAFWRKTNFSVLLTAIYKGPFLPFHTLSLLSTPDSAAEEEEGDRHKQQTRRRQKKLSPHFPDADDAKEEGKVKVGESPLFNQKFVFPHGEIIFSPKLYAVHNIKVQNILNMANLGRSVLVSKGGKTQRNVNVKSIAVDFGIVL